MESVISELSGYLISKEKRISIRAFYSNPLTMDIEIISEGTIEKDQIFSKLLLQHEEKDLELGRCQIIDQTIHQKKQLVFLDTLYDLDRLFSSKQIVSLENSFNNLSLLFLQKENVRDSFKQYVADLCFDLQIFKSFFDETDAKFFKSKDYINNLGFLAMSHNEGSIFLEYFDSKLKELETLVSQFSREEHITHGLYLRKQVWDFIQCSEFLMHCNLKPRGYAGDSELMRRVYENQYCGSSSFGKLLYKYSVDHPAAEAVRNRKILIPQFLREMVMSLPEEQQLEVMSVACGPAYELSELFLSQSDTSKYSFTLLDQDPQALGEAKNMIQSLEAKLGNKIKSRFLEESVRTMLRTPDLSKKWGQFHFIYSMGLFDYLTPTVAKAVIESIYKLLLPGGQLLIGNFVHNNLTKCLLEYWHDWVLFYRSEEEFLDLLADTDATEIKVTFEATGSQMFLSARKPFSTPFLESGKK